MSINSEAEPRLYVAVVYDRDGEILNENEFDVHDTEKGADLEGESWQDDPRYGSHEIERWEA